MNSVRSHAVFSFVLKIDRQCGSDWVFFHICCVTECVSVALTAFCVILSMPLCIDSKWCFLSVLCSLAGCPGWVFFLHSLLLHLVFPILHLKYPFLVFLNFQRLNLMGINCMKYI